MAQLLKISILMIFLIHIDFHVLQTKEKKYALVYPEKLVELAASLEMEPIGGKQFLNNLRKHGGQGLPYAFRVARTPHFNVLFWCQKDKKKYLVYAEDTETEENCNYEVKSVIEALELFDLSQSMCISYGIVVYEGTLGITKDLSHFSYLDNPNQYGPVGIYPELNNEFLPIIIYQKKGIIVLYRYQNRWLKYVKVHE